MSQFGIIVNVDKCIGCQACFVACKEENKVAPGIQWNQIHRAENLQDRIINYFRVSCQHCDNPACLPVCPAKAIYKGPHGEVLVDQSKCIGCGACVASCKNASAMLFTSAKIAHLNLLPQGQPERSKRVLAMMKQMEAEGFGNCTNQYECEAACPKGISVDNIARLNRDFMRANAKEGLCF